MAKHEQAVIDGFNKYFERQAAALYRTVRSFSLGGQDALAGADYILTDQSRFALVEFKYTQAEIIEESKKDRRLRLCTQIEDQPTMRALHDQCHFIAWAKTPLMQVELNIYRFEVCNRRIFGNVPGLRAQSPDYGNRVQAKEFATEFLSEMGQRSLSLPEFESYVAWLLRVVSGSPKSSFELLTYDDTSDQCAMVKLSSIREAYEWMQRQQLQDGLSPPRPRY